jgi:RND superfamily putative drug exporter
VLLGVTGISLGILGRDATSRLSYRSTDIYSHSAESFQAIRQIETPQHRLWRGPPNISVIVHPRDAIERTRSLLEGLPQVAKVEEHTFYSDDGNTGYIVGWVHHGSREPDRAARVADEISRPGVIVGGSALAQYQFGQEVDRDLRRAELIAFPLLILVGLWVFRSLVSALLPVAVGAVVVLSALGLMRAMTELLPISVFSLNIAIALALGLSVDYSLLLLSRFREEIQVKASSREAAWVAVATAGRTVFFSSAVIFASFASLMVFPIPVIRSMAFGGMLVAPLAALTALLMLPALFSLLGGRINALALRGRKSGAVPSKASNRGWHGVARLVTGHPRVVASGAVLLLVSLALPALAMRFTGFDATSLPASSSVRVFYERARSQFDNPIEGEIEILIRANQKRAERIVPRLVDKSDRTGLATPFPVGFEVARNQWLMDLNPTSPVLSQKTKQFVERLRDMNAPILVTGETAAYLDTQSTLKRGLPYALAVLAAVSFFILWMATGSVVLPIKALVVNLLVLGAVLGLLVVTFQRGNLQQVLGYESRDALVLTLPIVIAAGAFGVLTDYGLFLLMRIKETKDNGLGNKEAVAVGLEKAAGVITGAAVLFCAGVGAFASSDVVLIKEGAIGIAAAVALDAFVVRPFLIPSLMVLLGRWNWWPQQAG